MNLLSYSFLNQNFISSHWAKLKQLCSFLHTPGETSFWNNSQLLKVPCIPHVMVKTWIINARNVPHPSPPIESLSLSFCHLSVSRSACISVSIFVSFSLCLWFSSSISLFLIHSSKEKLFAFKYLCDQLGQSK